MKTLYQLTLAISLGSTLLAAPSFGQGSYGGGQGTRQDGELRLMDTIQNLEKSSRCDWTPMRQFYDAHPQIENFRNALDPLNAYLVQAFENESSRVSVCFAGALKSLVKPRYRREVFESIIIVGRRLVRIREVHVYQDPGNPIFQRVNKKLETIAFRYGNKVIIDSKLYAELSPVDQLFLLTHELGHAFIPLDPQSWNRPETASNEITYTGFVADDSQIFDRPSRLWSFINTLYQRFTNPGRVDQAKLSLSLDQNQVTLPLSDEFWRRTPDAYRTVFGIGLTDAQKSLALQKINLPEAAHFLYQADWNFLVGLYHQFYSPAQKVIADRYLGWQQTLTALIQEKELDPTLKLPGDSSLIDQALAQNDAELTQVIVNAAINRRNLAGIESIGLALVSGRIPLALQSSLIARVDPNTRVEAQWSAQAVPAALQNYARPTLFYKALEQNQFPIAQEWLQANRVSAETAAESLPLLIQPSSNLRTVRIDHAEALRRSLVTSLIALTTIPTPLVDTIISNQDEFAFEAVLPHIQLSAIQIEQLLHTAWATRPELNLIVRALDRLQGSIDQTNLDGQSLLDFALASKNAALYQALSLKGAQLIAKDWNANDKYWALTQLIELNIDAPIRHFLAAHPQLRGVILNQAREYALIRSKNIAAAAIVAITQP